MSVNYTTTGQTTIAIELVSETFAGSLESVSYDVVVTSRDGINIQE